MVLYRIRLLEKYIAEAEKDVLNRLVGMQEELHDFCDEKLNALFAYVE